MEEKSVLLLQQNQQHNSTSRNPEFTKLNHHIWRYMYKSATGRNNIFLPFLLYKNTMRLFSYHIFFLATRVAAAPAYTLIIPNPLEWISSNLAKASNVPNINYSIASFANNVIKDVQSVATQINKDVSSVNSVLGTNSLVNDILLPFTNFPQFTHNAQSRITQFETRVMSDVDYANKQLQSFTSVAGQTINSTATNVGQTIYSLNEFVQKVVSVVVSSPILIGLTLVNPAIALVTALAAADPVKLVTNYPEWQKEFNSRQSVAISNFNSAYSFVSTGLPIAGNAVLGALSQISSYGQEVMDSRGGASHTVNISTVTTNAAHTDANKAREEITPAPKVEAITYALQTQTPTITSASIHTE